MPSTSAPLGPAEIVVDLDAIRANARTLRKIAGVPLIAVVKSDGYGHGMVACARAAREGGAEWLATATIEEALALRAAGDVGPLLCWITAPGAPYAAAADLDIEVTAYSVAELDAMASAFAGRTGPARIQLKVDTGLSRGGAPRSAWAEVFDRARAGEEAGHWKVTGIWSHFACADERNHPANDRQEAAFREALALAADHGLRPELRHLANSAATLLRPSSRFDAVRCGIALYGLDPAPGQTLPVTLQPAMTVRAPLVMVKDLAAGDAVSYGHHWVAEEPTTVGLVPIGYAEGIPRHASRPGQPDVAAQVGVEGKLRPIRGTVCMDQVVVDLGGDRPEVGTEVVLFGPASAGGPTADDWAEACGTINYEIVTRIGGRMTRRYVGER
ncbi:MULTISPECIES: alanine racemase [unclassified Nocardioides]|uniref:alanine racemase n=1 Tax=unclassified Nocardioides TaxID=2615069 RepID=UPI0006FCD96C|nr:MULTISPECIES: alanine racemase [unclassified Nocardioides]KRA38382.1 alanine racemase [Nocardioides sp. Root614]KRA92341.1 alanine racemase [Nocardioides sp. Root682]